MTLEQIRKMSDDAITVECYNIMHPESVGFDAEWTNSVAAHHLRVSGLDYSRDLNAAMALVPSIDLTVADVVGERNFFICLAEIVCPKELDGGDPLKPSDMDDTAIIGVFGAWFFDCSDRARKICEAFLLWKGSAT